jgi:chromosome segregation ATPase
MSKFSGLIGASVLSAVAAGGLGYGYARVTQPDRVNHAEESARQAKDEFEKERAGRAEDKKQYQAAKVPLEKRINELETNNGSLAAQLDEAKKQVLARDKTIEEYNKGEATAKLQAQIKEYEANISGLKAQYETSKKAEEALQAKVAELSAQPVQTAESDAQLAEARKQAEAREEENKKLKEQVTVLTREVTEARSQLQKYETGAPGIAAAQKGPEIGEIILFSDEPFEKPEQEDKKLPDVGEIIW